ncbi:MAG: hypothetical protein NDI82_12745 [Anaeromyxobacteraceae bacterium]|nr:hypothetical protein [Anaeromyxobacteraceae bacterium]
MRRLLAAGLVGIALLFGGSLFILDRLSGDDSAPAPRAAVQRAERAASQPGAATAPAPVVPPGFNESMQAARGVAGPPPPDEVIDRGPPRVVPPPDSWEAVPVISARFRGKDPVAAALSRELADLHDTLTPCFDPAVASRQGGAVPTRTKDEVQEEGDTLVLVLHLEVQQGAVRVVDAPAASSGGASDATIACAQKVLRGKAFEVPGAQAAGRRRMQHALIP